MQKRGKKSWSKLATRVTLGLLLAGSTLVWAQGASAASDVQKYEDGHGVSVNGFTLVGIFTDEDGKVRSYDSFTGDATAGAITINASKGVNYAIGGAYNIAVGDNVTSNGTLNITAGNFNSGIFGGYSELGVGEVYNNIVNISQATSTDTKINNDGNNNIIGGRAKVSAGVHHNKINITGGTIDRALIGGYVESGIVKDNIVTISGASSVVNNSVYGGMDVVKVDVSGAYSETDQIVSGNKVIINNGAKVGADGARIVGGETNRTVDVKNNSVEISGASTEINGKIYGNNAYLGDAIGDTTKASVSIKDGATIKAKNGNNIYGGYSLGGKVKNNIVDFAGKIDYGNISSYSDQIKVVIYGGFGGKQDSNQADSVTGNKVNITGVVSVNNQKYNTTFVYGGYAAGNASVNENQVNITGEDKKLYSIWGAYSHAGTASGNIVNINDVSVYSVDSPLSICGAQTSGNAQNNIVNIANAKLNPSDSYYAPQDLIYGAAMYGVGEASGNKVNISGTSTFNTAKIVGAYSDSGKIDDVNIHDNEVNLSGGYLTNAFIYGAISNRANVKNNTINISGGKISGDIYGAESTYGVVSNNTVNITGGTIIGGVIAGKSINGKAKGNKIAISGAPNLVAANLYAGSGSDYDISRYSNNTLQLYTEKDGVKSALTGENNSTKINSINNFNKIDFGDITLTGSNNNIDNAYINLLSVHGSLASPYHLVSKMLSETVISGNVKGEGYLLSGYFSTTGIVEDNFNITLEQNSIDDYKVGGDKQADGVAVTKSIGKGKIEVGNMVPADKIGSEGEYYDVDEFYGEAKKSYIKVVSDGAGTEASKIYAGIYTDAEGKVYVNGKTDGTSTATIGSITISSDMSGDIFMAGTFNEAAGDKATTGGTLNINNGQIGSNWERGIAGGIAEAGNTGLVTGNAVNISPAGHTSSITIKQNVYGGYATATQGVKENTVAINNATVEAGNPVYGGYAQAGSVEKNTVTISGASSLISSNVIGGCDQAASISGAPAVSEQKVSENKVEVNGGAKVNGNIWGGNARTSVKSEKNSVVVSGEGTVINGSVYGNMSGVGDAVGDADHVSVTVGDRATIKAYRNTQNIYGGYTSGGIVQGNIVNFAGAVDYISGDEVNIYGGYGATDDNYKATEVTGNKVNITAVEVKNGSNGKKLYVIGGRADGNTDVTGNEVNITGGNFGTAISTTIIGGSSQNGNANKNKVVISNVSSLSGDYNYIAGATSLSEDTQANNNEVRVTNSSVSRALYGAHAYGETSHNTITLDNTEVIDTAGIDCVVGGYGSKKATDNKIYIINGSEVNVNVEGGHASEATENKVYVNGDKTVIKGDLKGGSAFNGKVESNYIEIKGGTVKGEVTGGYGAFSTVIKNKVSISGGSIENNVRGGASAFYSGFDTPAIADDNIVEISGGTFGAADNKVSVYGGYGKEAKNNKIVITKGANFDVATSLVNANLYGSNLAASETSGNTLDVSALTAATNINSINNFNTIIMGSGQLTLNEASNLSNTVVDLSKLADKTTARTLISGNLTIDNLTFNGISKAGEVGYNKVNDDSVISGVFKYVSGGAKATTEKITIEAGEAGNNIAGLYIASDGKKYSYVDNTSGAATAGTLKLGDVTVAEGKTYAGAYAEAGDATGGTVEISGAVTGAIYAGYTAGAGAVSGNTVKLIGSADASKVNIVGSNKDFAANANNVLDVTGWTAASKTINSVDKINSISFGDVALGGTYLTINGGSLNGTVITAGNLSGEGDLISGVFTTGVNVEALKGEAGKDKVTALSNGVQYAVAGGTAVTVNETSIHVKADAPDTVKAVAGVFYGDDGKVEKGNTNGVLTLDGSVTPVEGVIYAGAYAKKGKASGSKVKLTGDFDGTVYGGYSADGSGTENNTLEIDGSKSVTVNKIESVDTINIIGKVAKNGEKATLNVTEKADFANANVNIAGLVLEGAVKDTTTYNVISNAVVNTAKVAIDGLVKEENNVVKANIVNKDVTNGLTLTYGGKVVTGSYTDEAGTVTANGGVLKVSAIGAPEEGVIYAGAYSTKAVPNGAVDLDASFAGTLYGGYQAVDKKGTGTLNVRGKDLSVKEIANFNTINFFVPADLSKDGTVLKVESNVNIAGAKVNAGINNQSALDVGDEITLLEAESLDATGIVAGKVTENDFVDYDMNIEATNKQLKAKITSKGISNENSKSPVETIAGGLVMLNMGADQLAGKGFENAAEAVSLEKATAPNTMTTFASVGGNKVKAKTGSHVDLKGWNFNMGLAKEIDNKSGKLLIAPLAEYGRGSYDSYIDSGVHAEGTSKYWGVGVMARQTNDSGFYYEGSLVGGKSTNDYSTKDIGTGISYDTSAMYMNAHLGAGKIVELGEKDRLNYYGKFFYSRLGSDDVTLSNGAKYSFDASESKRVCLGGRWTRELDAMNKLYAGMAWQYEFDAESRATVNGKTAQAPTMKGHTGIFELGWNVKPNNAKFDIDMSFLGYTGKQKGGSLNVNMNWKF